MINNIYSIISFGLNKTYDKYMYQDITGDTQV